MTLQNATAIITGASRGLGAALAHELARQGVRLALVARSAGDLDGVAAVIRAEGGEAYAISGDVGTKESIYPIAGTAAALLGPIDLLIHCAGTLGPAPLRDLADTACEDLESALDVNVVGPFRLTKAVLGSMVLRGQGLVLYVSSDAAVEAYPQWGAYGASKAAGDHLMRIWAAELADTGVQFHRFDPGEMDTAMHRAALPDADRATLADPAEVARRLVTFLQAQWAPVAGTQAVA